MIYNRINEIAKALAGTRENATYNFFERVRIMTKTLSLKNLRKNKKGFTLVEIIVVLVIIAILAAIAIPSMMGFVDQARESGVLSESRTAYLSAQLIAEKEYAAGQTANQIKAKVTDAEIKTYLGTDTKIQKVGNIVFNATNPSKIDSMDVLVLSNNKWYQVHITGDQKAEVTKKDSNQFDIATVSQP